MARFLFATIPFTGHVMPGLPIARALVARGHEVRWYTGGYFKTKVEAAGAVHVPMRAARDFDDLRVNEVFPERAGLSDLGQLKFDLSRIFTDQAPGELADLEAYQREWPADVVVCDTAFLGAALLQEKQGVPWAAFGITAMTVASRDTAPFGLGVLPSGSTLGRLRNRVLTALVNGLLFRDVNANVDRVWKQLGLPPRNQAIFDVPLSPFLYLQGTVPSFEYPRGDLPPHVHFIGPFIPEPPREWTPPSWWPELLQEKRPVVHVTQGTLATDSFELILSTLDALAGEDVFVVAATGGKPVEALGRSTLPANARVERFIPYAHLLPRVSAMITNCGYGGVQLALAHGVPLIGAGTTEEKPEIANRIAWSGVGLNLKTKAPSPERIRQAVRQVLSEPRFRERAKALQAEIARYDAPSHAAELLETLARTRRPVLREGAAAPRAGG